MKKALRPAAWVALLAALSASGCPAFHKSSVDGSPLRFGVYRGRFEDVDGSTRRFKVLLAAETPDRLHAEILGPLGRPALILDGGNGRLSVTIPRERTAWAGPVLPEKMEQVLGMRIGLAELVGALIRGDPAGAEVEIRRVPASAAGLPSEFVLESKGRRLLLERRGRKRTRGASDLIGTGSPPPGVEVRPLEELGEGKEAGLVLESEIPPQ